MESTTFIGALITAITALWGYHVYWGKKKEEQVDRLMNDLKASRESNEKTMTKVIDVVEQNTKSNIELRSSVDANTKVTEALPETMTGYLIKAVSHDRPNTNNQNT